MTTSMESHQGSYDQPTIGDEPTKSLDIKTKYTPRELSAVQLVNICQVLHMIGWPNMKDRLQNMTPNGMLLDISV